MTASGVLFDLDGTLVYSLPDIVGVVNAVRARAKLPALEMEAVRPHIGRGGTHLLGACLPELKDADLDGFVAQFRALYLEKPHWGGHLYPGVLETLKELRSRPSLKLGIVTNKSTPVANRTLEHYLPGLEFDIVAGCDTVSSRKPDPRHLSETLPRLGLSPRSAWFVGDDLVDRQCAEGAGVNFLGACYGFGRVSVEPERRLEEFSEVLVKVPL